MSYPCSAESHRKLPLTLESCNHDSQPCPAIVNASCASASERVVCAPVNVGLNLFCQSSTPPLCRWSRAIYVNSLPTGIIQPIELFEKHGYDGDVNFAGDTPKDCEWKSAGTVRGG